MQSALRVTSIAGLWEEFQRQGRSLKEFCRASLPMARAGAVFAGAGDSYAASLAGMYLSDAKVSALDPYTLLYHPKIAKGREVYFVSVSGRTSSNVMGARRVRGEARKVVAITADKDSPLAAEADDVVRLPMTYTPRSVGILSFSLSIAAVLKISMGRLECDFDKALARAPREAERVSFGRGTTFFLGNGAAYPAAIYSAAKAFEVLGLHSQPEFLEEFGHMGLFSLSKSDSVNIFSCFDPLRLGQRLRDRLTSKAFRANLIGSQGQSDAARFFHASFVGQASALRAADSRGLTEPRFLSLRNKLEISDGLIY